MKLIRSVSLRLASCLAVLSVLFACAALHADDTFVYAVQISATVQTSPPQIQLHWEPDPYGAKSYTVFRKTKNATSWGPGIILKGTASGYTDSNVAVGSAYEYQVIKAGQRYTGYGYIYSGINAPVKHARGKVVLLVASSHAKELAAELALLKSDLIGDGWQVLRHDVSSSDTPAGVKSLVIADYNADPANVRAVFLFGHVPILRSGTLNYDGHGARPMPADAFYGDVNGDWSANPSYLPSDVELMVGRVDFFRMPGNRATTPWPGEVELLRNYLRKDHEWRHNLLNVPRRALMGNRAGDEDGEASAACGYRSFEPLVGPGNIVEANIQDDASPEERWISLISAEPYLWAYGNGGGDYSSISQLGTHGIYHDVWSADIVAQDARAVFSMLYGSHLAEWDTTDNIMRAMLATPSLGLAVCFGGRPHWFLHHMGLGEPIGYSARVTMNNSTLYKNQINLFTRAIYISLLGDPTLRLDPVSPPSDLAAVRSGTTVALNWSPSPDAVIGYHVYRAARPAGPYTRISTGLVKGTQFTDNDRVNAASYMLRAIKLQTTPSGTYYNPSQGIFAFVPAAP